MLSLVETFIRRADRYLLSKNYQEAEKIYNQILIKFPNNLRAKKGLLALKEHNVQIIITPQKDLDNLILFYHKNKIEELINEGNKLFKVYPKCYLLLNIVASGYAAQNQLDTAINLYKKAITLKNDYHDAYYNLGMMYYRKSNQKLAEFYFKKTIMLCSNHYQSYNDLGNIYRNKNEIEMALTCYNKSKSINPKYSEVYTNLGTIYRDLGMSKKSISYYQKALTINKNQPEALYNLSLFQLSYNNF
jgi:Tfp pilus assembly protein PilF